MDKIKIGNIDVSKIAFGTADFGTARSDEEAFAQLDMYVSLGGNLLDTARVYGQWASDGDGASQKALGRWLESRNCREKVIICDKGAHPRLSSMNIPRVTPEDMENDLKDSFEFLKTDYIDIYFLHRDNPNVPVSEIIDFLHEKVSQGKIRAIGASNWTVQRINEANEYAKKTGKTPFVTSQIGWSFAKHNTPVDAVNGTRSMTAEEYGLYLENKVTVMAYSSQAKGFFSRYDADKDAIPERFNNQYLSELNIKKFERIKKLSQDKNISIAQLSLAALINNPVKTIPIVSAENLEQLKESLDASKIILSQDEMNFLWG